MINCKTAMELYEKDMQKIIPEGKIDDFEIIHFTVKEEEAKNLRMRSMWQFSYNNYNDFEPGNYIRMVNGGEVVMSDTIAEKRTCIDLLMNANGHVLITGLGLGVTLMALYKMDHVKSIIVIVQLFTSIIFPMTFPSIRIFSVYPSQ